MAASKIYGYPQDGGSSPVSGNPNSVAFFDGSGDLNSNNNARYFNSNFTVIFANAATNINIPGNTNLANSFISGGDYNHTQAFPFSTTVQAVIQGASSLGATPMARNLVLIGYLSSVTTNNAATTLPAADTHLTIVGYNNVVSTPTSNIFVQNSCIFGINNSIVSFASDSTGNFIFGRSCSISGGEDNIGMFGYGLQAGFTNNQVIYGQFNASSSDSTFILGTGVSNVDRYNSYTVKGNNRSNDFTIVNLAPNAQVVNNGSQINSAVMSYVPLTSAGVNVTLNATPITAGTNVGQTLKISNENLSNTIDLPGYITLNPGEAASFIWSGAAWRKEV